MKKFAKILFISILVFSFFSSLQGQTLRLTEQQVRLSKPDLAIETLSVENKEYICSYIVKNHGSKFTGNCRIYLLLERISPNARKWVIDDRFLVNSQFPRQNGIGLASKLTNGTYKLTLYIDYGNKIKESNERNNRKETRFTVYEKLPDLSIEKLSVTIHRNQIYFVMHNKGGLIFGFYKIGFMLDRNRNNIKVYSFSGGDLQYGPFPFTLSFTNIFGNVPKGVHYLTVMADYPGKIKESNERNNISSVRFIVE